MEQPVGALSAVNQRLPAKRVFWHVRKVIGGQFAKRRWQMSLLRLVTTQGRFKRQQTFAGHHCFVFRFGLFHCLPGLPPARVLLPERSEAGGGPGDAGPATEQSARNLGLLEPPDPEPASQAGREPGRATGINCRVILISSRTATKPAVVENR